uniref:Uncharacterized protein n=1 Tax=Anguilla anguilla TaxID=7936 RepID=A0A0E9T1R7_ANGAN
MNTYEHSKNCVEILMNLYLHAAYLKFFVVV